MADRARALQPRLEEVLRADLDRAALLRELQTLAQQPGFSQLAHLWAPALYAREPRFFESFLLRQLNGFQHAFILRQLLPLAEQAGQDNFYQGLLRSLAASRERDRVEHAWNDELAALAHSAAPDDEVQRAVERRNARGRLALGEAAAVALYQRSPDRYRTFIQNHLPGWWLRQPPRFHELRRLARLHGDDALYWELFRRHADTKEWQQEIRGLLAANVPADRIVAELRQRHPARWSDLPSDGLLDVLEHYGEAALPYIESHVHWFGRQGRDRLLKAVERLGHPSLYWAFFFKLSNPKQWNDALQHLLRQPLTAEMLWRELQWRTPPGGRWRWWRVEPDLALDLYQRDPVLFRPWLEQHLDEPDARLWEAATQRRDEEFLDYLSFKALQKAPTLAWQAYPPPAWRRKGDQKARDQLESTAARLVARFERLHAQSPEAYVRHAANILGRFRAREVWSFARSRRHDPAFAYLAEKHWEAWHRSAAGPAELLESPNIYIQILGLTLLSAGGAEAARHVRDNLLLFRALLLGRARRNTKKLALRCLEHAAQHDPAAASQILPLLEEALLLRGKRAIGERVMVSFVRLRRQLGPAPAPATAFAVPARRRAW